MKPVQPIKRFVVALFVTMLTLATSACVERVVEERPRPPVQEVIVQRPPPPEVVEVQPPPPGPGDVWVWQRGNWRWDGRDYHWFPGRWVQRPPQARAWQPPRWEARGGNGYVFIEGNWQ